MKTLILNSSPKKNGHTSQVIDLYRQKIISDCEVVNLHSLNIKPCIDCSWCFKNKGCSISDDMDKIYEAIESSDTIVLAAPLYFNGLPGTIKNVIDRCHTYWSSKFIRKDFDTIFPKKKTGILIMTSGVEPQNGFAAPELIAKTFFQYTNADLFASIYAQNTAKISIQENLEIRREIDLLSQKIKSIQPD